MHSNVNRHSSHVYQHTHTHRCRNVSKRFIRKSTRNLNNARLREKNMIEGGNGCRQSQCQATGVWFRYTINASYYMLLVVVLNCDTILMIRMRIASHDSSCCSFPSILQMLSWQSQLHPMLSGFVDIRNYHRNTKSPRCKVVVSIQSCGV